MKERDYVIYIPSRERAKWLLTRKDVTVNQVKHLHPVLFIRNDDSQLKEYEEYAKQNKIEMLIFDSKNVFGIAQTYDRILSFAIEDQYKYLMILDDDLSFQMHQPIINKKPDFSKIESRHLTQLFSHIRSILSPQIPALSPIAIAARSKPHLLNFCNWLVAAQFLYVPHFKEHPKHRFAKGQEIESRCDQNFTFQLLRAGFLTVGFAAMFYNTLMHNPGGCSLYRTLELEQISVRYLKHHYPEFVRLRHLKGWLNDKEIDRIAPVISWKKAFNRELFRERFGIEPINYCKKVLLKYELIYSNFISQIRKEHNG